MRNNFQKMRLQVVGEPLDCRNMLLVSSRGPRDDTILQPLVWPAQRLLFCALRNSLSPFNLLQVDTAVRLG